MMLAITNIAELVVVQPGPIGGRSMGTVRTVNSAALVADAGRIVRFGPAEKVDIPGDAEVVDARGGCVIPGLIDCHTHTVFAGSRENEFVKRLRGKSYAQIAEEGGGIKVTVEAVRKASVDELVELALPRLRRMLAYGVTTVEIKSGYGLTVVDEIKMLEAIKRLKELTPLELVAGYLAAHTVPREFAGRAGAYLDEVLKPDVLRRIVGEGLAEFADVFCERTAFDLDQSRRYLNACKAAGLTPRLHADQITQMGASRLAAEVGAASADHLETIDDASLAALRVAGTIAVLLPACSLYLGVEQAPARKILDADVPVAVATDFNPGSCMIESLPLTLAIACTQMRMTPTEALLAATANAAAALKRQGRLGAIAEGMQADLVVLDVPNHHRWFYEFGRDCVATVIKQGKLVYQR
ncbi:MAG: imidazolonepropionase [Phycisphaerae bacterium]|nr:imidazolonepropionase [Phycisphaerae bacterium]